MMKLKLQGSYKHKFFYTGFRSKARFILIEITSTFAGISLISAMYLYKLAGRGTFQGINPCVPNVPICKTVWLHPT